MPLETAKSSAGFSASRQLLIAWVLYLGPQSLTPYLESINDLRIKEATYFWFTNLRFTFLRILMLKPFLHQQSIDAFKQIYRRFYPAFMVVDMKVCLP